MPTGGQTITTKGVSIDIFDADGNIVREIAYWDCGRDLRAARRLVVEARGLRVQREVGNDEAPFSCVYRLNPPTPD
jgi:hypothetical protein